MAVFTAGNGADNKIDSGAGITLATLQGVTNASPADVLRISINLPE